MTHRIKPLIALFAAILTPNMPAAAQQAQGMQAPRPIGRLVNVEGHRMHIHCTGKGTPTVILEAGIGAFSFDWALVQPEVSRFTRVCSYDRAGQAWSEPGPQPRTIAQKVHELHALLKAAGIPGPYVLVGHSGGGYIVRQYQAAYPKEVVGIVLVECGHEDSLFFLDGKIVRVRELSKGRPIPAVRTEMTDNERAIAPDVLKKLEQVMELIGKPAIDPPYDKLPPNLQHIRLWALAEPKHLLADNNPFEGEEMAAMYAERQKTAYPLGDLPLIVLHRKDGGYKPIPGAITAEQVKQLDAERLVHNKDLAHLSRNSAHIIARNSSHDLHLDRPELVIEAIRQVVEAARHHGSVKQDEVVK